MRLEMELEMEMEAGPQKSSKCWTRSTRKSMAVAEEVKKDWKFHSFPGAD